MGLEGNPYPSGPRQSAVPIDGVPIPEGVSSTFTDVISPRMWERADIILGGMEAQYGNKTALVVDITSKSGTRPPSGSVQQSLTARTRR